MGRVETAERAAGMAEEASVGVGMAGVVMGMQGEELPAAKVETAAVTAVVVVAGKAEAARAEEAALEAQAAREVMEAKAAAAKAREVRAAVATARLAAAVAAAHRDRPVWGCRSQCLLDRRRVRPD